MDEREKLRLLAQQTLDVIARGVYTSPSGQVIHIRHIVEMSMRGTLFYSPQAFDNWETLRTPSGLNPIHTRFSCTERTTLQAAQEFANEARQVAAQARSNAPPRVGVLNFASATKPGGGFKNGAKAQEESIARVSALYASLTTPTGLQFYKRDARRRQGPTYSDAMVYSPHVLVFNTDELQLLDEPYEIAVVTSPAVNAGEVRDQNRHQDQGKVERAIGRLMYQRMARILALFQNRGDNYLVLGSYGTGVFRNPVETVASIWMDLLVRPGAPFENVFERVDFAIIGHDTFERFNSVFQASIQLPSAGATGR